MMFAAAGAAAPAAFSNTQRGSYKAHVGGGQVHRIIAALVE
jgi:hypothetical protein